MKDMTSTEKYECPFPENAAELDALVIIKHTQIFHKQSIEQYASRVFRKASVVCPESLKHLEETAARASKSFNLILVGGGDGTLNRVIQKIDFNEAGIAVAALGSGNDFARNFQSAKSLAGKFEAFKTARWQKVDLIRIGSYLFHNSGGVGLDAATLKTREQAKSKFGRDYNVAFLKTLARLKPLVAEIEINEARLSGRYLWALAMNNRWIGGGMLAAPSAKIDDGLLDCLLVGEVSKFKLVALLPQIYSGAHVNNQAVDYIQARAMTVRLAEPPGNIALDGELYPWDKHELKFEIVPKAVWVFGHRITK